VGSRWLSKRAVLLHLALLTWVPGCLVAGWWQATRAFDGNALSYVYSVEWPLLAVAGVAGWWSLLHTDPDTAGARAQRRAIEEAARASGARDLPGSSPYGMPDRRREEEDAALAAYNDRLAQLSAGGPKTWRRR